MSEIKAAAISNLAGTGPITLTGQTAAKARLIYNAITNTVNGSENISSVTDNGTGDFTQNYTNAFTDTTSYTFIGIVGDNSFNLSFYGITDNASVSSGRGSTSTRFTVTSGSAKFDPARTNTLNHGDLA